MPVREDLFAFVVGQLRHGATQAELSEMLNECVNRTRETGSAATLTLTLKILPDGDGTGNCAINRDLWFTPCPACSGTGQRVVGGDA